uniref:Uncharacterized protein n=1 Tax=Glossina pallidipes TaxID=7398 RepID=A0A1B0A260_GLOPL
MSDFKSTQYLTVNTENHLLSSLRKDSRRSLTPRSSVSFNESSMSLASLEDLRAINSDSRINRENTSSSESSTRSNRYKSHKQRFKSSDALCFGLSRKKLRHRKSQLNNDMMIVRPRCYTDPGEKSHNNAIPLFKIPQVDITAATPTTPPSTSPVQKRSQSNGMLNSLLKQTLKVTSTASMGLRTLSAERLAPHTFKGLNEDVKRKFSSPTIVNGYAGLGANIKRQISKADKPEINCSKSQSANGNQFEEHQEQQVTAALCQSTGGIVYQANGPIDFDFTKMPKNSSKLFFIKTYSLLDNREHPERPSHCEEKARFQKSSNVETDFVHKSTIIMEVQDKTQTIRNNASTLSMACGMKRESFLRHSLQTIRRSFTSKKSLKPIEESCSATKPPLPPSQQPILSKGSNFPNVYISTATTTLASGLVITLNPNLTANNEHSLNRSEKSVVGKRASICNNYPTPAVADTHFCTDNAVVAISKNNENNCHLERYVPAKHVFGDAMELLCVVVTYKAVRTV